MKEFYFNRFLSWRVHFKKVETTDLKKASFEERKKLEKNGKYYLKWAEKIIRKASGVKTPEEGKVFTILGMKMSKENVEYLHNFLDGMTWLCYAPASHEETPNNKIQVEYWYEDK